MPKHPQRIILTHITSKNTPRTNVLKNEGKTAINASGTARRGRGFHTPDTCQNAIKIIISGKIMYFIFGSC